jgi:hypothetical protein
MAGEASSVVVLVIGAGFTGAGLVWFNKEATYGLLPAELLIEIKTSSLLSPAGGGAWLLSRVGTVACKLDPPALT